MIASSDAFTVDKALVIGVCGAIAFVAGWRGVMAFVVLGLGSNRAWNGNSCIQLLQKACCALKPLLKTMRISSVYCTKPMYVEAQDDFYNMVVCGDVSDALLPHDLLSEIHRIEASLGRDRTTEIRNGPRSIDIDIELFGAERIASPDLQVPHPRLQERAFVLVPMLEIFQKNADCIERQIIAAHEQALQHCGTQGVHLYMDAQTFMAGCTEFV